jgi:hypothetical protein
MSSALRSAIVFSFVFGVAALSAPGCSQQGEGERCDRFKAGDGDCDSGLECVALSELLDRTSDRCCPAPGTESDDRCRRGSPTNTAGTGGGGSGAEGGNGGAGPVDAPGGAAGAPVSVPPSAGAGGESAEPSSGGSPSAGAASGGAPSDGGMSGSSAGAGGA